MMEGTDIIVMMMIAMMGVFVFLGSLYLKKLSNTKEAEKVMSSSSKKKRSLMSVLFLIPLMLFSLQIATKNTSFFWAGIFATIVFFFWAIYDAMKMDIEMSDIKCSQRSTL